MLVDEAKIKIQSGKGGDGHVSFRREKYVPRGGPDGGDGGNGGDVWIEVSPHTHGLEDYRVQKLWRAEDGAPGGPKQLHGKTAEDLILQVPPGTVIWECPPKEPKRRLSDLVKAGEKVRVAVGGNGGWGNQHFATSIKQAPDWAKPGMPGEEKELLLEWQLMADVGLIGLPNAGKSTLLSVISNARPKIANYPFTTLEPELGVAEIHGHSFVVADIPGLTRGASEGKGLGDAFLRHVKRTKTLVHLVSAEVEDPAAAYQTIRAELAAFDRSSPTNGRHPEKLPRGSFEGSRNGLVDRPEIVALSKSEILPEAEIASKQAALAAEAGQDVFLLSAATGRGVKELLEAILNQLA